MKATPDFATGLQTSRPRVYAALTWFGARDDPGSSAVPPVIFLTSRAAHTHFNVWERIENHSFGVEPGRDGLAGCRTPNEDVAVDAVFG
jgi:hypothetical protein